MGTGRPPKQGLSFFPMATTIFEDPKVRKLRRRFGPLGEVVWLRLLCRIYDNGWWYPWNEDVEDDLIESIGAAYVRGKNVIQQVIPFLAEIGLVDPELLKKESVLTSAAIQGRYAKATNRRVTNSDRKYWLLEEEEPLIPADRNQVSVYGNRDIAYRNLDNVYRNRLSADKDKIKEKERKIDSASAREKDMYREQWFPADLEEERTQKYQGMAISEDALCEAMYALMCQNRELHDMLALYTANEADALVERLYTLDRQTGILHPRPVVDLQSYIESILREWQRTGTPNPTYWGLYCAE